MKVLFASYNDYSNLCQGFSDALNSIGIESSNAALSPHAFGYTTQVLSRNQMRNAMRDVDCIVIGHTHEMMLDLCAGLGKRLFVIHTGTIYRQNPEKFNAIFNPVVERVLIDSPEFFDFCHKAKSPIETASIASINQTISQSVIDGWLCAIIAAPTAVAPINAPP